MAKDSMLDGAVNSSGFENKGNSPTNNCQYNGDDGYDKRKGGRLPEVNRIITYGPGKSLEKRTPSGRKG